MVASAKYMKQKSDNVHRIVMNVMSMEVPQEGQLVNPFKPKRKSSRQTTLDELLVKKAPSSLPDDVQQWTAKNFVTYFSRCYQKYLGGNYKITYTSDLPLIKQIGDFFNSNGLEKNEWTKKIIDWCFVNQEDIIRQYNYLTLQSIVSSLNYFYQDEVLPKIEHGDIIRESKDISLLKEIEDLQKNVKPTELFARFGIPITITYLCKNKNYEFSKVISSLHSRFGNTVKTSDVEILERIFNSSIINSPYPDEYLCLDWRNEFNNLISFYKTENWWRNSDYKGKPLDKYNTLLGGD